MVALRIMAGNHFLLRGSYFRSLLYPSCRERKLRRKFILIPHCGRWKSYPAHPRAGGDPSKPVFMGAIGLCIGLQALVHWIPNQVWDERVGNLSPSWVGDEQTTKNLIPGFRARVLTGASWVGKGCERILLRHGLGALGHGCQKRRRDIPRAKTRWSFFLCRGPGRRGHRGCSRRSSRRLAASPPGGVAHQG